MGRNKDMGSKGDVPAHRIIDYDRARRVSRCPLAVGLAPSGAIQFETVEMPLDRDPEEDLAARTRHLEFGTACFVAWRCFQNRGLAPPSPVRGGDVCPVCLDAPTRPVAGACGHWTCYACLVRWRPPTCPVCRNLVPVGGVYFLADEHARLAREDPGYAARLAAEAEGTLGFMPEAFRRRFADPGWMASGGYPPKTPLDSRPPPGAAIDARNPVARTISHPQRGMGDSPRRGAKRAADRDAGAERGASRARGAVEEAGCAECSFRSARGEEGASATGAATIPDGRSAEPEEESNDEGRCEEGPPVRWTYDTEDKEEAEGR